MKCHSRTSERHRRNGFKRNATVGRLSDITERALKEMPQSGVLATPHKGLEKKVKYNNATVGPLSDIAERALKEMPVNNTHNKHSIHENKRVSPSTGIIIQPDLALMRFTGVSVIKADNRLG